LACQRAETAPGVGRQLPTHNSHKYLLLFIKYYDARAKQLRYVTQMVLHRTHMLDDVMDEVRVPVLSTAHIDTPPNSHA